MNNFIKTASVISLSLFALSASAKVSPEKAEQLGTSLTPLGAEMAGNAAGTIPAWTGGLHSKNSKKSADTGRPDSSFTADKPLFEITASNYQQYEANLSAGQIAMFNKYAD